MIETFARKLGFFLYMKESNSVLSITRFQVQTKEAIAQKKMPLTAIAEHCGVDQLLLWAVVDGFLSPCVLRKQEMERVASALDTTVALLTGYPCTEDFFNALDVSHLFPKGLGAFLDWTRNITCDSKTRLQFRNRLRESLPPHVIYRMFSK